MIRYFYIATVVLLQNTMLTAQITTTIEEYNELYNQYSSCLEKRTVVAPWLCNGTIVIKGTGFVVLKTPEKDTIPFLYHKGRMVFNLEHYDKLKVYENVTSHEDCIRYATAKDIFLSMSVFEENCDSIIINQYCATFPIHWILCCYEDYNLASRILRITSDCKGNYLVSLDTYGRYFSYTITQKNKEKQIKRRLRKKHKKMYGQK